MAGCSDLNVVGVRAQPLPESVSTPCPHPTDVIASIKGSSVSSDEIRMGHLGDALIDCGQQKQIAVNAYTEVANIIKE